MISVRYGGFFVGRVLLQLLRWCEDCGLIDLLYDTGACEYPQLRMKQVDSMVWQAWPESLCVAQSGCRDSKQGRDKGWTGSGHEREAGEGGRIGRMGGF